MLIDDLIDKPLYKLSEIAFHNSNGEIKVQADNSGQVAKGNNVINKNYYATHAQWQHHG